MKESGWDYGPSFHEARLAEAARQLGLRYEGGGRVQGLWRGISVGLELQMLHRRNAGPRYLTRVRALHPTPLRVGLVVTQHSSERFAGELFFLRHQPFDNRFRALAHEPAWAAEFLRDDRLIEALMRASSGPFSEGFHLLWTPGRRSLDLTDVSTDLVFDGWESEVGGARKLIDDVCCVSAEVARRSREFPRPPAERAAQAMVEELGRSRGLQVDLHAFQLRGRYGPNSLEAGVHCHHGVWTTWLWFGFPEPLELGLRFRRDTRLLPTLGKLLGDQDIVVGHDELDEEFMIMGEPEEVVARLLEGEVADRIVELKAMAQRCDIGDAGVRTVSGGVLDAAAFDRFLVLAGDLASAMVRRARALRRPAAT